MLGKAMQLCSANFGVLNTFDGTAFHTAATYGLPPAYDEYRRRQPLEYGPGTAPARLLNGEPFVQLTDLLESEAYRQRRAQPPCAGRHRRRALPACRSAAQGRARGRQCHDLPAGEPAVLREADRAAPAVRRAGRDRHREHAAASRVARKHRGFERVAATADRDVGSAADHQLVAGRPDARIRQDAGERDAGLRRRVRIDASGRRRWAPASRALQCSRRARSGARKQGLAV